MNIRVSELKALTLIFQCDFNAFFCRNINFGSAYYLFLFKAGEHKVKEGIAGWYC